MANSYNMSPHMLQMDPINVKMNSSTIHPSHTDYKQDLPGHMNSHFPIFIQKGCSLGHPEHHKL